MAIRQEIRFCTGADGVQLALALYGKGPPLLKAATWLTHVENEPVSAHTRQWIEEFEPHYTFITYDTRGCGLSQRRVDRVTLDAWVDDLEAVVAELGLKRFPLLGLSSGAAIAVAYAARHPEQVSQLILFGGYATSYFTTRNDDPRIRDEAETLLKVAQLGWGQGDPAFRQVFVSKFMPHASAAQQQEFDDFQRLTATPEMAVQCLRAMFNIDVKAQARQVRCPTLVFHARGDRLIYFEQGRKLAGLIPGARLVPVDSDNHVPFVGEPAWPAITAEIRAFLGTPEPLGQLTPRQSETLRHVAAGKTDKEIARELQLSPRTVEMHVAGAIKALGCATRAEAVHRATAAGILGG